MAAADVLQQLQSMQSGSGGIASPPFDDIVGPSPQPDGTDLFTFGLSATSGDDLTIPVGRWKLRLIPVDSTGTAQITMRAFFEDSASPSDGAFRSLEIDLTRLELEAHPDDLIGADLVTDPYTHLIANPALGPVRLLGPSMTLILAGPALESVSARFGSANGGTDPRFPSARFDPPHFLIGPSDGLVGVASDEVLLDLSGVIDPTNLDALTGTPGDGTFKGVILKELGLFIGDPEEVGTWAGMARVQDFVLRFDPLEITGVFEGELVHAVAPDDPQVEVELSWESDSGQRLSVTEVDPTIPAPIAPERARRVRVVATPNWASVGFQVNWNVPDTVEVEDPSRLDRPDLGWVRVPPGSHQFTVDVTDHRVDPVTATRTAIVQAPAAVPVTPPLAVDLVASVFDPAAGSASLHLYLPLVPSQLVTLRLTISGGTGDSATSTLTLPAGWQAAEPLVRSANRLPSGGFQQVSWVLTVGPTASEGSFGVTANLGTETQTRQLRYTVREAPTPGRPGLELIAFTDWRPNAGLAPAMAFAHDGLAYDAPIWKLAAIEAPANLLSSDLHDDLFADDSPAFDGEVTIPLATSGGLVKPGVDGPNRLHRLVADIAATQPIRPPSVVLYPDNANDTPRKEPRVTALFAERPSGPPASTTYRPNGREPGTIRFAWRSDAIQPTSVVPGHGDGGTAGPVNTAQALGFADLFRALIDHEGRIDQIGLFASASTEGDPVLNKKLSNQRLTAAINELTAPSTTLINGISDLPPEDRLSPAEVAAAAAIFNTIPAADRVEKAWGEENQTGSEIPEDRRVFAVLQLKVPAVQPGFRRRTYFLVRNDAPVAPSATPVPMGRPQQHPFRHSIFRSAHVEVELRRNTLIRFQIRLELDLERFDENDLDPAGALNPSDGIVTGFLELRRNPDPAASPKMSWELDLLAAPSDVDGLLAMVRGGTGDALVGALGGPLIALPAMAAASGGRSGPSGLLVALGVGTLLQQVGVFDVQTVIWKGLRLRLNHGGSAATRFSVALDYEVSYDIDVDLNRFGIPVRLQTTTPIDVSFRNVGVEVTGEFDNVELFYDPSSGFAVDIADPGVFQLGEGLGRLLRVDDVSLGAGSPLWLEVELGFALDVGVFEIESLRIRLSLEGDKIFEPDASGVVHLDERALDLDDLQVSINKLGVALTVPGVLDGHGVLGIKEEAGGTTVEGELAVNFEAVPVLRGLNGQLKLFTSDELRALYLSLGIDYSPGLPLGSTGIAIYGMHGLLGANMAPSNPDPLPWLRQSPVGVTAQSKWAPERGAWNFGVGASFGTVFDGGFAFNLVGTFLLQIPGPRFLLTANATVLSPRPDIGTDAGVLATVLLDFENDLIVVGVDFTLSIKPILELHVPIEAYFNLADASDFHIRFGEWAPVSRRATLRVFDAFDAWGYLQIEGGGLNNGAIELVGTSIGAGARIEIEWGKKGLLYLEAFGEAHAGIQFKPLYFEGSITVGGEIHVGPASIGAHGQLAAKVQASDPEFLVLRGEVCGKIDLWLTSITKCVDFELGDEDSPTPAPESVFAEATAVDRMTGLAIDPRADGTIVVPLDAVIQLTFTADITDSRPAPGLSLLSDMSVLRNQMSAELFYEFELIALDVRRVGGAVIGGVTSAWAPYTLVSAAANPPQSQRTLRLFDWKPSAHPRQIDFGSATESALAQLFARLCDPIVAPPRQCTDFDEEPFGPGSTWLLDQSPLRPVRVIAGGGGLGTESQTNSGQITPRVTPIPGFAYPQMQPTRACLHLGRPGRDQGVSIKDALENLGLSPDRGALAERAVGLLEILGSVASGAPLPSRLASLRAAGIILIQVPSLVSIEVTVATPSEFHGDAGEIALLSSALDLLDDPLSLGTLPPLDGATTPTTHPDHVVRRLSFGTPDLTTAGVDPPATRWFALRPPSAAVRRKGHEDGSLLLEICGITLADWREFRRHHENVLHAIAVLTEQSGLIAGEPAVMAEPLLQPGAAYEVDGSIAWSRYRSRTADPGDTDGTSASSGGPLAVVSPRFVADPDAPGDLTRYIADTDPFDDEQPQFVDEPIIIRYASSAIDRIYAAYGKQLVIRAKADSTGHVLIQPTSEVAGVTFTPIGPLELELFESLTELSQLCLPGEWGGLFPQPIHTVSEPLMANTNYTVAIFARPASEPAGLDLPDWQRLLDAAFELGVGTGAEGGAVYRFDVRTSRWNNLGAQLDAFRSAEVGDLFIDDPAAYETVVSAVAVGSTTRSDSLADALCIAATGGPIPIPREPGIARLWVAKGSGFRCVGLLIDGPEPLLRRRLVGVADVADRVTVDLRRSQDPTAPFQAGQTLAGHRLIAGARGARLFACFDPKKKRQTLLIGVADAGPSLALGQSTMHTVGVPVGLQPGVLAEGIG